MKQQQKPHKSLPLSSDIYQKQDSSSHSHQPSNSQRKKIDRSNTQISLKPHKSLPLSSDIDIYQRRQDSWSLSNQPSSSQKETIDRANTPISLKPHKPLPLSSDVYQNQDSWSLSHKPSNSQKETLGSSNSSTSLKHIATQHSVDLVNKHLSHRGNKYEVLLSYSRGKESQESFSGRLCLSLRKYEISVLKDLKDDISNEVLRSIIEGSRISIIIFSEFYASSRRCLEELANIVEFHRAHDYIVLPIFYGVNPSEVQNLESSFGKAFQDLVQSISPTDDEVSRWRAALRETGGYYGFFVPDFDLKKESAVAQAIVEHLRHIQDIVEHVRHILPTMLYKDDVLVGLGSQVEEVIKMLHMHESNDVVSIGIWGMGGIGKSTIARLIFDQIRHEFERTLFVSDVRHKWKNIDTIISEATKMRMDNHDKKVLVVLDDVNDLEQLHAIRGSRGSFGRGSRIIITTRDLYLLQLFQVDDVYTMKLLSHHDSLQLFSSDAFEQVNPDQGQFMELCRRMVAYTEGLPLALRVLGSFFDRRSMREWESTLMKLITELPPKIYDTLKLSFDSLDSNIKELFINIVLFYIGEDINDVIRKLARRGCNASKEIRVLVDRSLVIIDDDNRLQMHNLLQLMGRKIILETSQNQLLNRGKLWLFCEHQSCM